MHHAVVIVFFFFNDTATTEIYTLSLHDALPISAATAASFDVCVSPPNYPTASSYPVMGPTGRGAASGVTCAHGLAGADRKSTRLNSRHAHISYAVFFLKKKKNIHHLPFSSPPHL